MFNIGDKVRMLKDIHEGVVSKVRSGGLIEIETTDGFVLPVLETELVKINVQERISFPSEDPIIQEVVFRAPPSNSLIIGYEYISKSKYSLNIINDSDKDVVGILNFERRKQFVNEAKFIIEAHEVFKINHLLDMSDIEIWSKIYVELFTFEKGESRKDLLGFSKSFKKQKFLEPTDTIPIIDKIGVFNSFELKSASNEGIFEDMKSPITKKVFIPELEIDLHAEKLNLKPEDGDILNIQFEEFLKSFDRCIIDSIPKLIIIHGVGNGILKTKVQQFLAKSDQISVFKDAQKNKFGFGATEVHFK